MKELWNFSTVKWRNLFHSEKSLDWKEKGYLNLCVNNKSWNERRSVFERKRNIERKNVKRNAERKNMRRTVGKDLRKKREQKGKDVRKKKGKRDVDVRMKKGM